MSNERASALIRLGSRRLSERGEAARKLLCLALTGSATQREDAILVISFERAGPTRAEPYITVLLGESNAARSATLSLDEIQRAAEDDDLIRDLVIQRLFSITRPDRSFRHRQYSPKTAVGILSQAPDARVTQMASLAQQRIQADGLNVALIGHSASGKTVAAAQVSIALEGMGWRVVWLDMADSFCEASDLVFALTGTTAGPSRRILIVVDDIQANPAEFRRLGKIVPHLTPMTRIKPAFLLIAWESARALAEEILPEAISIPFHGDHVIAEILSRDRRLGAQAELLNQLRHRCRGNVLLATLGADIVSKFGRLPSDSELAQAAWDKATQSAPFSAEMIRMLYRISSLSQLQIDVARAFGDVISQEAMTRLCNLMVLRVNGDFVSLGHASMAALVLRHLKRAYPDYLSDLPTPPKIALDYLRNAGDRQIAVTLERLDLARLAESPLDQHGTALLARAWESFHILLRLIAIQVSRDPSWGDNIASAIFGAMALAEVRHELWEIAAQFIRHRWEILDGGELPIPLNEPTKERIDFDEIEKSMKIEEASRHYLQRAEGIDFNRFHRTWVLGLLLGFEGTAIRPDRGSLERLKRTAAAVQLPDGSFYPSRVPWVTARIILGLVAAGESAGTSDVVKKACTWLRRPAPLGPFSLALWESGTGAWNSAEQVSALCIEALVRAGISPVETDVAAAHTFVLAKRNEWTHPGKEIDAACSMQTYLLVRRNWREISSELDHLLAWARDQAAWADPEQTASDLHTESSKAPFVANALIGIVWEIVTDELPLLIEELAPPDFDLQNEEFTFQRSSLQATTRDALNELRATITKAIAHRETIAPAIGIEPGQEVRSAMNQWVERRKRFLALQETFENILADNKADTDLTGLIFRVDDLGKDCKGVAWMPIKDRG